LVVILTVLIFLLHFSLDVNCCPIDWVKESHSKQSQEISENHRPLNSSNYLWTYSTTFIQNVHKCEDIWDCVVKIRSILFYSTWAFWIHIEIDHRDINKKSDHVSGGPRKLKQSEKFWKKVIYTKKLFLTNTIRNVPGDDISHALSNINWIFVIGMLKNITLLL
jgi:hypothetical protein